MMRRDFRELKVDYMSQTQNGDLLRFQLLKVLQEKI